MVPPHQPRTQQKKTNGVCVHMSHWSPSDTPAGTWPPRCSHALFGTSSGSRRRALCSMASTVRHGSIFTEHWTLRKELATFDPQVAWFEVECVFVDSAGRLQALDCLLSVHAAITNMYVHHAINLLAGNCVLIVPAHRDVERHARYLKSHSELMSSATGPPIQALSCQTRLCTRKTVLGNTRTQQQLMGSDQCALHVETAQLRKNLSSTFRG